MLNKNFEIQIRTKIVLSSIRIRSSKVVGGFNLRLCHYKRKQFESTLMLSRSSLGMCVYSRFESRTECSAVACWLSAN